MLNICTLGDKNYLVKGLTLYRNLKWFLPSFTLHYLCLDSETKEKLDSLNYSEIITYLPEGEDYEKARTLPVGNYGNEWSQFCWACCPIFFNQILNIINFEDDLFYIDTDIYFLENPDIILNYIKRVKSSFSLHSHRCEPTLEEWSPLKFDIKQSPVGFFNVGVVYANKSWVANDLAELWKKIVLERPENLSDYLKCGDQAALTYLCLNRHSLVSQFDNINSGIAHLAPWNVYRYQWLSESAVDFFGETQLMTFVHFSHFTPDFVNDKWSSSINGEWKLEINEQANRICEEYFTELKKSYTILNANSNK